MNEFKAPNAEMKELTPDIYVFIQPSTVYVSNAGLIVGKNDAIVIDSLTNKYMVENFIGKIKQVTDRPISLLINTHAHADHILTNHFFVNTKTICTSRCREVTANWTITEERKRLFPHMSFEGSKFTPQDITFDKALTIYQDGREIRLIDLGPGHSQSDTIVFLPKEKIVFCGDLLTIGLPPQALWGSVSCWIQNLDIMASLDADIYVPGHGPISGRETVYEYRQLIALIRDEARKCFYKGMSYDEAAQKMDLGRFKESNPSAFLMPNIVRCYCEFRGEQPSSPLPSDVNPLKIIADIANLVKLPEWK